MPLSLPNKDKKKKKIDEVEERLSPKKVSDLSFSEARAIREQYGSLKNYELATDKNRAKRIDEQMQDLNARRLVDAATSRGTPVEAESYGKNNKWNDYTTVMSERKSDYDRAVEKLKKDLDVYSPVADVSGVKNYLDATKSGYDDVVSRGKAMAEFGNQFKNEEDYRDKTAGYGTGVSGDSIEDAAKRWERHVEIQEQIKSRTNSRAEREDLAAKDKQYMDTQGRSDQAVVNTFRNASERSNYNGAPNAGDLAKYYNESDYIRWLVGRDDPNNDIDDENYKFERNWTEEQGLQENPETKYEYLTPLEEETFWAMLHYYEDVLSDENKGKYPELTGTPIEYAQGWIDEMAYTLGYREDVEAQKRLEKAPTWAKGLATVAANAPVVSWMGAVDAFGDWLGSVMEGKEYNPYGAHSLYMTRSREMQQSTASDLSEMTPQWIKDLTDEDFGALFNNVISAEKFVAGGEMLGSVLYTLEMGMETAPASAAGYRAKGIEKDKASLMAATDAAIEMGTEFVSAELFVKNYLESAPTSATGVLMRKLVQDVVEGSEEVVGTYAGAAMQQAILGSQSDVSKKMRAEMANGKTAGQAFQAAWDEVGEEARHAFVNAVVSSALVSTPGAVIQGTSINKAYRNEGSFISAEEASALRNLANDLTGVSDIALDKKAARSVERAAKRYDKNASVKNTGKLSFALREAVEKQNVADVRKAMSENGVSDEDVKEFAPLFERMAEDPDHTFFTEEETEKLLKNETLGKVYTDLFGPESSAGSRMEKYALARAGANAAEGGERTSVRAGSNLYNNVDVSDKISDTGTTVDTETGGEITIDEKNPITQRDGKTYLNTSAGEILQDDIKYSSEREAQLYEYVSDLPQSVANAIVENYKGQDNVRGYVNGMRDGILLYGYNNIENVPKNTAFATLDKADQQYARQIGQTLATEDLNVKPQTVGNHVAVKETATTSGERVMNLNEIGLKATPAVAKKIGAGGTAGAVYTKGDVDLNSAMGRADGLLAYVYSSIAGNSVVLYDSKTVKDADLKNANGKHVASDGTIYLDIRAEAGNNVTGGIAYTLGHELTHETEQWAKREYAAFRKFLYENYIEKGTAVEDLIAKKMSDLDTTDRAYAESEVVADACERMLLDSDAMEKLAELRDKEPGTFKKILDFIKRALEKIVGKFNSIREVYETMGAENTRIESKLVQEFGDNLKKLQDMWSDMVVAAAQNRAAAVENEAKLATEAKETPVEFSIKHRAEIADVSEAYAYEHRDKLTFDYELVAKAEEEIDKIATDIETKLKGKTDKNGQPLIPEETKLSNNIFSNSSYLKDAEPTTECWRQMVYRDLYRRVTDKLGRPLTTKEAVVVNQAAIEIGIDSPCLYCYSLLDRKAKEGYKLQYLAERDGFLKNLDKDFKGDVEAFKKQRSKVFDYYKQRYLSRVDDPSAYDENGVYDKSKARTENESKEKRVNLWLDVYENLYKNGNALNANDIRNVEAEGESKAAFSNIEDKAIRDLKLRELKDVLDWAQASSQAKKLIPYSAYSNFSRDSILNWSKATINKLNSEYGLRWYSHADYHPAFVVDNMQQVVDASLLGLKGLMYCKPTEIAKIMAPTGMNINVSCFVQVDPETGDFVEDAKMGAPWKEVQDLRKEHKNVGAVMVVTSDEQMFWALTQGWIDVVIPIHLVRAGDEFLKEFGLTNYTSEQADKLTDKQLYDKFIADVCAAKGISEDGKTGKALKKGMKTIYPTEHQNDYQTYMDAINERGLTPRFDRIRQMAENGTAEYDGVKVTPQMYMKLVNETRQSAAKTSPLRPVFDNATAEDAVNEIEKKGYHDFFKEAAVNPEDGQSYDVEGWADIAARDIKAGKTGSQVGYGRNLSKDITSRRQAQKEGIGGTHDQFSRKSSESYAVRDIVNRALKRLDPSSAEYRAMAKYKAELDTLDNMRAQLDEAIKNNDRQAQTRLTNNIKTQRGILNRIENSASMKNVASMRDVTRLADDAKKLREMLKLQSRETNGTIAKQRSVNAAASEIMEKYGIKRGKGELAELLGNYYTKMMQSVNNETMTREAALDQAKEAAEWIARHVPDEIQYDDNAIEALDMLRGYKVKLNDNQRQNIRAKYDDINGWRRAVGGYITLSNEGKYLDELWPEWAERAPGYFTNEMISDADMPERLAEIIDSLKKSRETVIEVPGQYEYDLDRAANDVYEAFWNIEPEQTVADKYAERIKTLKAEHNAMMSDLRKSFRDTIREERSTMYAEAKERAREYGERLELRRKVRKIKADLTEKLGKPTAKKFIPADLRAATSAMLTALNNDNENYSQNTRDRIAKLQAIYDSYKDENIAYDEQVSEWLSELRETVGSKTISELTKGELESVYKVLRAFSKNISDVAKVKSLYAAGVSTDKTVDVVAKEWMRNIKKVNPALAAYFNTTGQLLGRPELVFRIFGNMDRNSIPTKVYDMLNAAQREYNRIRIEGNKLFEEMFDSKEGKKYLADIHDTKQLYDISLKDADGKPIKVTKDFALWLNRILLNENAIRHVATTGGIMPDFKQYYEGGDAYGKKSTRAVGVLNRTATVQNSGKWAGSKADDILDDVKLRAAEIDTQIEEAQTKNDFDKVKELRKEQDKVWAVWSQVETEGRQILLDTVQKNIEKIITPQDQKFLDLAAKFYNEWSKNYMNKASNERFGIDIADEENYTRIHTADNFRKAKLDKANMESAIGTENMGFTKRRVGATNPIYFEGLSTAISKHIDEVATYAAYLNPLYDLRKILDFTEGGIEQTSNVKRALTEKFGKAAVKYIYRLAANVKGQSTSELGDIEWVDRLFNKLLGRTAEAALTANGRVIAYQMVSALNAAAELGYGRIAATFLTKSFKKAPTDLIAKYTPVYEVRRSNGSTDEVANMKNAAKNRGVWYAITYPGTHAIQAMDLWTVGRLWFASESYVKKHNKNLKPGTDEFYKAVAKKFTDVVELTQPNYTPMQRNQLQRSKNPLARALTMFKTQPFQNLNNAIGASFQFAHDIAGLKNGTTTKAEARESGAKLYRTATSLVASAAMMAVINAVWIALVLHGHWRWKDDETGEFSWEKFGDWMLDEALGRFFSNDPLAGEAYSFIGSKIFDRKYYPGFSMPQVEVVTDALETLSDSTDKIIAGEWNAKKEGREMASKIGRLFGLPVDSIVKPIEGIYLNVQDIINGEFGTFNAGHEYKDAQLATQMLNALEDGNTEKYDKARGMFKPTKTQTADQVANSALTKAIKASYMIGETDKETAEEWLAEYCGKDSKEIYTTLEKWNLEKEGGEKGDYKVYDKFAEAVRTGKDLKAVIKEYKDVGYTEDNLNDAIRNSFKAGYIAASNAERAKLKGYLLNAYVAVGYDKEKYKNDDAYREKKSDDIDKWVED